MAMEGRRPPTEFSIPLSSQAIKRRDVEVFALMYCLSHEEAARRLAERGFNGRQIRRLTPELGRTLAANAVFLRDFNYSFDTRI